MDPIKLNDLLPGTNLSFSKSFDTLSPEEVKYLFNLTGDSDFDEAAFARAKDMSVDAIMTNFVLAYKYEDCVMAGDVIMPPRPVRSRTGFYHTRGREALDVSVSDTGSDKGETNEIMMKAGSGTYAVNTYKLKIFVSDAEIKEVGPLNAIQEATILLKHALELRQEIRVRNLAEACTLTAAAAGGWHDDNTVHADVATAKNAVLAATGQPATHIVIPENAVNLMLANAGLDSAYFGTVLSPSIGAKQLENIDAKMFAALKLKPWGLTPIFPNVYYSTAVGPAATEVPAVVWLASAFVVRVDTALRSSGWGFQPELMPLTIIRWRDEDRGGWYIKAVRERTKVAANTNGIYEITGILS